MRTYFAVLLGILQFGGTAFAQETVPYVRPIKSAGGATNLLNAVACNAAAASRTVTATTSGCVQVNQVITLLDADTDETAVTITCTKSSDASVYASSITRSCTSGACVLNTLVDTRAMAAGGTQRVAAEYGVFGWASFRCVYACAGAAEVADKLTATWACASNR